VIQIESIHIQEFRGIRDLTLKMNRSSFVVSGPNGSGKSGVVDAIQFALSGEIGRLKGARTGDLSLSDHGPHVERRSDPEAACVTLTVYIPHLGKSATITRTIKKPKQPHIVPSNFDPIHANRLAQDRPVILVDYRGVGHSGGEMPDSIPATAADIITFVKALGLKEIDLFGFSIGGMVAQQVVLDAPELVRRILLAGTGPSGGEGMQEFSSEVMDIVNRPNSTEQERTLDLFFSKSPTSYAAGEAWLQRIAARKLDREPEAKPQVGEAQLVALAKWGAIPANYRYGDLKKIKQRTLVVNGKDDMMVPTINSYILQQHLPDARLILYPDSGHGSHFQFFEEFAEEAARFFAAA
jgi:pimeloyl-ACP methyl ester carboxylesterase